MINSSGWTTKAGWWKPALIVALLGLWLASGSLAHAASPQDDMARLNAHIEKAQAAAEAGNATLAAQEFTAFENEWTTVEDSVRAQSKTSYQAIEGKINPVKDALARTPVDTAALATALDELKDTNQEFINTNPATGLSATSGVTVSSVLSGLDQARQDQAKGDYAAAAREVKTFQANWLEIEGPVKARSMADYSQTENDMNLAYDLLTKNSAEAKTVLDRMYNRLQPYATTNNYGIVDAALILLREGLEALLVVVALLTFLKKSGNAAKQPWIWVGVGAGLTMSVLLAIAIQLIFGNVIKPGNRELIEGITGLVAASMLIYVSYWMHSKSSAGAWQRYIKQKSTAALAQGSLFGLALLSFLAIFREGAETALFYLGIGPSISTSDLLIGLGLGLVLLVGLGFLLIVVGLRIPMGPFFTVASILVFFLCFKFLGTGVHALQTAKVLPVHSETWLPSNDFFGMYSSWETTLVQALLLAVAIGVVVVSRVKENAHRRAGGPGVLSAAK